jgi:hypothetical protein
MILTLQVISELDYTAESVRCALSYVAKEIGNKYHQLSVVDRFNNYSTRPIIRERSGGQTKKLE